MRLLSSLFLVLSFSFPAWPWGGEGHRIVASNAIQLLPEELRQSFRCRPKDLAYYAGVPDGYWKSIGLKEMEAPSHFLNMENFSSFHPLNPENVPHDPVLAQKMFRAPADKPQTTFRTNGILPWRISQIQSLLVESFEQAAKGKDAAPVGLHAGLLAHYVGDAAQPFHATYDYDGARAGHGGIHSYFESDVVNELARGHQLQKKSLELALRRRAQWSGITAPQKPALMAVRVLADSYRKLGPVYEIDRGFALLKNQAAGPGGLARRPAANSAVHFLPVVSERLALASASLARLIENAWASAGKPRIGCLFGPVIRQPKFIPLPF